MSTTGSIDSSEEGLTTDERPSRAAKDKRTVYLHVNFIKVGEISTMKESFDAEIMIKSRWREPSLDGKVGDVPLEKQWNPLIYIQNTVGDPQVDVSLTAERSGRETFVVERKKFRGTFVEFMELRDFPFDVQELSIHIKSHSFIHVTQLVSDPDEMHTVHKRSFMDEQEFYLYKHIEVSDVPLRIDQELRIVRKMKPSIRVTICVARRPHFYIWNICLLMSVLIATSFSSFGLDVKFFANRLQLTFGLVLAAVTFKHLVNAHLPKISYFTYLDAYVMTMLLLLVSISCFHGLMTRMVESWKVSGDRIGLFCFVTVYVLFHLSFITVVLIKPYSKRRQMKQKERIYQIKYSAALKARQQQGTNVKSQVINVD